MRVVTLKTSMKSMTSSVTTSSGQNISSRQRLKNKKHLSARGISVGYRLGRRHNNQWAKLEPMLVVLSKEI